MIFRPSASNSSLLIECSYPYGKELDHQEPTEPARYGSAFHQGIAARIDASAGSREAVPSAKALAKKFHLDERACDELKPHVDAAFSHLKDWLSKNEFQKDFAAAKPQTEVSIALTPLDSARKIEGPDEDHVYREASSIELPGTADLLIAPQRETLLVIDHKTGEYEDFSKPSEKPQLLSLAAGAMRFFNQEHAIVGVLHARRRGLPKVYAEKVKLSELRLHETRLQTSLARIGDGSMRPGPWCKFCPARTVCPAQDAELLERAGDVLTGLTAAGGALSKQGLTANDVAIVKVPDGANGLTKAKKMGLLFEVVRKAEALAARARIEMKNEILADPRLLPETPSGEYLVVREYEKENLSKRSVLEAYGKIQGEKTLAKLRADGAIKSSKVQQLWPEKER